MLNRFTKFLANLRGALALCLVLAVLPAAASIPPVVATSTTAYAKSTGFGYVNKVIVDPYGNVYATDSSNGTIWEVPVGTSTPIRLNSFPLYASVSAGGSGYTSVPTVTFSAPAAGGVQATAVATVNSSMAVSAITITNHGSGYTATPTITIAGGGGTGATGSTSISLNATHGFAVDQYGDLIVSNASSGNLYFFPYINGQLCTTCNAAGNEPLDLTGTYGFSTLDDYYGIVADVAADSSGNLYVAMSHCNNAGQACGLSGDSIFLIPNINPQTTSATIGKAANGATLFQGALPGGKAILNMTVDTSGHLYYVDGANAYVVGTATANQVPVTVGSGFKAPSGISLDPAGNLYIVDNSLKLLYEIPNEAGALNAGDQFVIAALINPYYSVGFDHAGNIYQADGTDKVINRVSIGSLSFGATPLGTPLTANVTYRFNASVTPAGFTFAQGLGASGEFANASTTTCAAGTAYTSGQSCIVSVTFSPSSTGNRQGGVVMQAAASKSIVTAYLSGIGTGGALTVDPGTQISLTGKTAWKSPSAIALDAAGNTYVADFGANTVQVVSAAGAAIASIGSGLSGPLGVTVDGAGNVFIADTGNSRIVEVPNEGGTLNSGDQTVLAFTGLMKPVSVAVDPTGGVYVADMMLKSVVRLPAVSLTGTSLQIAIGSGYTTPVAVATDASGNVYVADLSANNVQEIDVMSTAQSLLVGGLSGPTSLSLDASGSLYVVESGSGTVYRIPPKASGALDATQQLSLGNNLVTPTGVAVNGAGVVAISDAGTPGAYTLQRTIGLVNFGNVNISLSSSPQTIILTSAGNAPVTLGATAYTAAGATADYAIASPSGTGCTNSEVLTIGATCSYSAVLSPIVPSGTLTDTLTFSSNALNASPIAVVLTGVATNLSLSTTVLSQVTPANAANPVYGQAVTVSASVTTARAGVIPTGSITFSVDGIKQKGAVTLSTSAPYTASLTIAPLALTVGTHAITASYSGDANNASSSAVPLILQVTPEASSASAVVFPNVARPLGSTFTFYFTVSPTTVGAPSGTVNLVLAGTSNILGSSTLTSGSGTIAYTPTALGQFQFQLVYLGDANFSGTTSNSVAVSIRNPGYDVSLATAGYTVTGGLSTVVPVTVTWISGYTGNVGLGAVNIASNAITPACSGLPQYVTCVFSPGSLTVPAIAVPGAPPAPTVNPTAVMNLTLATSVPPATPYPFPSYVLWPGGLGLTLLSLLGGRRRGRATARLRLLAMVIAGFSMMLAFNGCGSGSTAYATPKGTSTITLTFSGTPLQGAVSATNPNIVDTLSVQLTVQ